MGISWGQVCFRLLPPHIPGVRALCLQSVSNFRLVSGSLLIKTHVETLV